MISDSHPSKAAPAPVATGVAERGQRSRHAGAAGAQPSYHETGWAPADRLLQAIDRVTAGRAGWIQRFVSYAFVGGFAAVVNLVAFTLLYYHLQLPLDPNSLPGYEAVRYLLVFAVAAEVSTMTNFIINDRVTFSHLPGHARHWYARCARFHLTALSGTLITLAMSYGLISLGLHATLSEALAIGIVFLFNFAMHHLFTYRHMKDSAAHLPAMPAAHTLASMHTDDSAGRLTGAVGTPGQAFTRDTPALAAIAQRDDAQSDDTQGDGALLISGSEEQETAPQKRVSDMVLSVVIPAHNEEENIRPTVEKLVRALRAESIPYEIVVVNDHSSDHTEDVLRALTRRVSRRALCEQSEARRLRPGHPDGAGELLRRRGLHRDGRRLRRSRRCRHVLPQARRRV